MGSRDGREGRGGRRAGGARSLHCRGYDVTCIGESELRSAFEPFGVVVDVYLPKDYFTKSVRGFAYIQFENESDAEEARLRLDRTDVFKDGNVVNIMWAAGERKTPTDMRRLDVERDNPHARREREGRGDWDMPRGGRDRGRDEFDGPYYDRRRDHRGGRDRGRGRGDRGVRDPEYDRGRPPPRGYERDMDRDRGYDDRRGHDDRRAYDDRRGYENRRGYDDRHGFDDRGGDYRRDSGRKRDRSRSPSIDRYREPTRRRFSRSRSRSRSPPMRRKQPPLPLAHRGPPLDGNQHRSRSRSRSRRSLSPPPGFREGDGLLPPPRSPLPRSRHRSPDGRPLISSEAPLHGDPESNGGDHPFAGGAPKLRSAPPKLRSAPLSPLDTIPASPDSR